MTSEDRRFLEQMRQTFSGKQSEEQESLDITRAKNGDTSARLRLIAANASMIVSVVRSYTASGILAHMPSLQVQDLYQEAQMGFNDAINRFENNGKARLATYAAYRVRDFVSLAVRHGQQIRLSRAVIKGVSDLKQTANALKKKVGHYPTQAELVSQFSEGKRKRVRQLLQYMVSGTVTTDTKDDEGKTTNIYENLTGENSQQPESFLEREDQERLFGLLEDGINTLDKRSEFILRARFLSDQNMTKREIAHRLGITASRVGQLEIMALKKLRSFLKKHIGSFGDFFD